jgi:hypothetical protein
MNRIENVEAIKLFSWAIASTNVALQRRKAPAVPVCTKSKNADK